jgi:hypothetical protein
MRPKGFWRDVHSFFKENNFVYLFVSLTSLLFVSTLILELPGRTGADLFSAITVLMIVTSIKSVKHKFDWKRIGYMLASVFLVLALFSRVTESKIFAFALLALLLIFFIGMFMAVVKDVLFHGEVDANKIIGSISLYMLLGLVWAVIYLMLLSFDPKAFSGIEPGDWQETFASVAYYSFVTLTTLGYGDILPKNHVAEFFVYMEAIIGVFYMAIIVSSLVSLMLSSTQKRKKTKQ